MNYLVDSHTHLHDREFFSEEQATEMLKNAKEMGVLQMICIGTSNADSLAARDFAEAHENVFWSYGVHPEEAEAVVSAGRLDRFENMKTWPERPALAKQGAERVSKRTIDLSGHKVDKLVAIGEIGLDYHYPGYNREKQIALLEEMLDLAIDLNLPVSFHVRDALDDFFGIIKNFSELKPSVLHSFSDSRKNLETALSLGFYIGMNGMATFANLDCYKNLTPEILDRLVLETDAPFLTPVPKRGKINEPGNVKYVADWLSKKLGVSLEEISEKTTRNVQQIFHLPDPRSSQRP